MGKKVKTQAQSYAVIGKSNGPTSIFLARKKNNPEWTEYAEHCRQNIMPKKRIASGEQIAGFLTQNYQAEKVSVTDKERQMLKVNVLTQSFKDRFTPPQPPEKASKKALKEWASEYDLFLEGLKEVSEQEYGLTFAAYLVPKNSDNQYLFEKQEQEQPKKCFLIRLWQKIFPQKDIATLVDEKEIRVVLELSTGLLHVQGGNGLLMNEIILWRGVSQGDMDKQTPIFYQYISAMRCRKE